MKKYFLSFILLACVGNLFAHQPDISTTLLSQQANNQWVLQVKASLTAFKYEVTLGLPDDSYSTPEEFQELVIRHVMDNVSIVLDGNKKLELKQPFVQLGHETNVVFEVIDVPEDFNTIEFKNSSFKDINRNKSALVILKKGFSKNQFILNNENEHTALLEVKNEQFVSLGPEVKSASFFPSLFLVFAFSIILGIIFLVNRGKRKVTN